MKNKGIIILVGSKRFSSTIKSLEDWINQSTSRGLANLECFNICREYQLNPNDAEINRRLRQLPFRHSDTFLYVVTSDGNVAPYLGLQSSFKAIACSLLNIPIYLSYPIDLSMPSLWGDLKDYLGKINLIHHSLADVVNSRLGTSCPQFYAGFSEPEPEPETEENAIAAS